jgi:hypothetical protein
VASVMLVFGLCRSCRDPATFNKESVKGFHRLRRLVSPVVKMSAGCWRSQLLSRSRPPWPDGAVIPGMPAGRCLCPWPTQIVIPTTLAPKTSKVSWSSMGLRRFYSSPKLIHIRRSPRDSHPAGKLSILRSSPADCRRPSRDVLAPRRNRLRVASQPLAGARLLGT